MIQLDAESFGFLIDLATRGGEPTIGLQVNTGTDSYVIPLDPGTAENVANVLMAHVSALASATKALAQ